MNKQTIAVDFDGVIHKYSKGYQDGVIYDPPVEGVVEALRKLSTKYDIVIFTARPRLDHIADWLHKHKVGKYPITKIKPKAIAYIDDRGIRFTNWRDILKYFI